MDNYPPGAARDPRAPYNQSDPPEVEVELTMTETLTKSVPHCTNKVWRVYDEEGYGSWESDGVAMAWMETATKLTAEDIYEVMKKYNIFIV